MLLLSALLLTACASNFPAGADPSDAIEHAIAGTKTDWADGLSASTAQSQNPPEWQHFKLPGKRPSQFAYEQKEGRDAVGVLSQSAASLLRLPLRVEPSELGQLRFSWHVPELISQADMALREADDAPVRIVLAFDGDRGNFSAKNAMLNELSRAITGEEMPYATLMYVWCNDRPVGSIIQNARTDRVRKLVVQSGSAQLDQWLDYERDIRADYLRVFGEAPGALVGIAIMTDTDNTQTSAKAWYGPLSLTSPSVSQNTIK